MSGWRLRTGRSSSRSPAARRSRATRAKIKDLWGPSAKAWWDSPDDPNIRLLTVKPDDAEFWDGPGKIIGTIKMVAAAATNSRPNYGENRKVAM